MEPTPANRSLASEGRPRLFAMVTTRRSRDYTPIAIRTFLSTTPLRPEDRLILISNDDPDGVAAFASESRVHVVSNPQPKGFAENANAMIEEALRTGSDLFFMNNDVVFFDQWLEPLLGRDDIVLSPLSNREVQYAASIVVVSTGHVAETTVLKIQMRLEEYQQTPRLFDAIVEAHRKSSVGLIPVIVMPFFCVRIPLPVLQRVGKFDTRFGVAGGEDYDYCFRLWLAGIPVSFQLSSYLLHFWGKSTTVDGLGPVYDQGFLPIFKEKWGEKLFSLVLEERSKPIDDDPVAKSCRDRGDIAGIVRALQAKENDIFLP